MESNAIVLVSAAGGTAVLHALIPDHWLPFVVMGRTRNWSLGKTLSLASLSAGIHVCLSVGLVFLTYFLGRHTALALSERIGETLEVLSSLGLLLFGLTYGAYSWNRERRHHPGGSPTGAGPKTIGHSHHHGHLLERLFSGELSAVALVTVIGVSPCALAFPILLTGATQLGWGGAIAVSAAFGIATLLVTLIITWIGAISARTVDLPFLTRYGDLTTGLLIALVGLVLLLGEVMAH